MTFDEPTLQAVRKLIDYEADGQKMWFNECTKEGFAGGETQKIYQSNYNTLVTLREKLNAGYLGQSAHWTYPNATERLFIQET